MTETHVWKTREYPSLGKITVCVCGASRYSAKDDTKLCKRTERRHAMRLCADCFRPKIVGQAFTSYICNLCRLHKEWPNTGIPAVCPACADERGLCVNCGNPREPANSEKQP